MRLYEWQEKALNEWNKTQKGIVEAGTGTGKTNIGLEIIKQHKVNTLICCPTNELVVQWKNNLLNMGVPNKKIGQVGAGKKELNKYTIATYNAVREILPQGFDMVIVDEIHHLGSEKNKKILDLPCKFFLGLTATLERADDSHLEILKKYSVIFSYSSKDGVEDNILASYKVEPVFVQLTNAELEGYENYDNIIKGLFNKFDYDYVKARKTAGTFNHPDRGEAQKLCDAINRRKEIVLRAENRINKVADLICKNGLYEKMIVFCELKEVAEEIQNKVDSDVQCFLYHSGLKTKERKQVYENFQKAGVGVVISCKALEEGVDFPACKMGIVAGGSGQKRQAIQRLGRFLRKFGDMEAIVYDVVIKNTIEEKWFKKRYDNW